MPGSARPATCPAQSPRCTHQHPAPLAKFLSRTQRRRLGCKPETVAVGEMDSLIICGVITLEPNNGQLTTAIIIFLLDWFSRPALAIDSSRVAFLGTKTLCP